MIVKDHVIQNALIVIAARLALYAYVFAHVVIQLYQAAVNVKIAKSNAVVSLVMGAEIKAALIAALVIRLALLMIYVRLKIVLDVRRVIYIHITLHNVRAVKITFNQVTNAKRANQIVKNAESVEKLIVKTSAHAIRLA